MVKKILSAELTEDVLDAFATYVYEHGYVKYRCLEAAMKAFMALPANVQSQLMKEACPQEKVRRIITEALLNLEIQKEIDSLGPARAEFLNLLLQAKAKVYRKK